MPRVFKMASFFVGAEAVGDVANAPTVLVEEGVALLTKTPVHVARKVTSGMSAHSKTLAAAGLGVFNGVVASTVSNFIAERTVMDHSGTASVLLRIGLVAGMSLGAQVALTGAWNPGGVAFLLGAATSGALVGIGEVYNYQPRIYHGTSPSEPAQAAPTM